MFWFFFGICLRITLQESICLGSFSSSVLESEYIWGTRCYCTLRREGGSAGRDGLGVVGYRKQLSTAYRAVSLDVCKEGEGVQPLVDVVEPSSRDAC